MRTSLRNCGVTGPLTALQEKDIADCFGMLDEDGSGALDVSELVKAFKMLGFQVPIPISQ
jgi:Ca2+-binding EF-hand superfamily protein